MSEKFIVMRSSSTSAPYIIGVRNTYKEAHSIMLENFITFVESHNPTGYSHYEYGAKAFNDFDDHDSTFWTIEKTDVDNTTPENNLTIEEQLPNEIIAVVYNWKGCVEENYLFTPEDFGKFVGDSEDADSIVHKINEMRTGHVVDFAFSADKTFSAWIVRKCPELPIETSILNFLMGKNNDDAIDMVIRNYNSLLSPIDNIKRYEDWYYKFMVDESSKEIVDVLSTNPVFKNLMEINGGCVPESYLDTLHILLEVFEKKSVAYKSIKETIEIYKAAEID